jgi:NADH:ubiquinone oxidoreductase subunit 6 (subunit J)
VEAYGQALLTTHLLPFELASIILLLALVAAAYLSRKADDAPQTNDTH